MKLNSTFCLWCSEPTGCEKYNTMIPTDELVCRSAGINTVWFSIFSRYHKQNLFSPSRPSCEVSVVYRAAARLSLCERI